MRTLKRERREMWKVLTAIIVAFTVILSSGGIAYSEAESVDVGWLTDWDYRIKITVDHNRINSGLFDFPLLIHLSSYSGISGADVSSIFTILGSDNNRRKIAVTGGDGTTQLYVEIEKWDTVNAEAFLWVKVPVLSSGVDTMLYLYYDEDQSDNTLMVGDPGSVPAQKVWDINFVMVQHLRQNGTTDVFKDSTAHHHDGIQSNKSAASANISPFTPAPNGWATFDGISDYVEVPDSDHFSLPTTGELTISIWLSPAVMDFRTATDGYINFMGKGNNGQYEWSFVFYNRDSERPQRISFYLDNIKGGPGSGSYTQEPIAENEWVYITARVDSQKTYMYRNGRFVRSDYYVGSSAFVEIHPENGTEPVRMGTRNMSNWFEGRLRETRISNIARSDTWIAASYYSESDSLMYLSPFKNEPPKISISGGKTVQVGDNLSLYVSAVSPDGKPVACAVYNLPEGASFDSSARIFSWTPGAYQTGSHPDIRFEASDGILSSSENLTITVIKPPELPPSKPANQPPILPGEPDDDDYSISGITIGFIIFGVGILVTIVVPAVVLVRRRLRRNNWTPSRVQRKTQEGL